MRDTILVIGSSGQIGTDLVDRLREIHGADRVVSADIRQPHSSEAEKGPFETLDVLDRARLEEVVSKYNITQVYHLVAMLSATAERFPMKGWDLNMASLFNLLEMAKEKKFHKLYWPSSIAAFGPHTPRQHTPQYTVMDPGTVYGISKLSGELWCEYYFKKFGVDVRSLRYPGLISYKAEPGGGTTDYAVEIFHKAKKESAYTCYIAPDTVLPMMYMPDAIKATIGIMDAPAEDVKIRTSYNVAAFSFDPEGIASAIRTKIPDLRIDYEVDSRNEIALGWPQSINDEAARADWGWHPDFTLSEMVDDMLNNI